MATIRSSNPLVWLFDPIQPTREGANESYRFSGSSMAWVVPTAIGVIALVATFAMGFASEDRSQFYFSYLTAWSYGLSLAVGALFFVLIQHVTKARWSVVFRRIPEALLWSFPLLAVLGIPVLLGMHDLYEWTHEYLYDPTSDQYDAVLDGKRSYLNTPFFLGRMAFYFVMWTYISYRLYTVSVKQDESRDIEDTRSMRFTSAWGLAITAVTTAFASFDILMSTYPHWFSTIFGVYFFAGSFLAIMAFMIVLAMAFQRSDMMPGMTVEHYQDLGKFMFGFVVFWAYIAFSQYMLIWYGNLPEETVWYKYRLSHGWEAHSAALLIAHFILPFLVLVGRWAKRLRPLLAFMAVWILVMHWFDFHWIVMPVLHADQAQFSPQDFTAFAGITGVLVGLVVFRLSRHSMVPQGDPRLKHSLHFKNT
ncbi:MAG: hypothetical protein JJ896_05900 [Rhodothermales bacterium]|nr:hypothetical protein [Rhodothermales bacterium]MBO6779165.1 hypothetical protein [Rhodothermales bacterium]